MEKENEKVGDKDKIVELNAHAKNFLLFSYFGIKLDEWEKAKSDDKKKKEIATKCAERAYLDLNRTLRFAEKSDKKGLEKTEREEIIKKHLTFRNYICEKIVNGIIEDLFQSKKPDDFNSRHFIICDTIQKYACGTDVLETIKLSDECKKKRKEKCNDQKFYYGQAQKWLNMTLKYMWLLGLWNNKFENIKGCLHVPVDSYIIKYVWKTKVVLPMLREERDDYGSEKVVPWSKWIKTEYEAFQKSLKETFKLNNDNLPLEWEGNAWIKAAKEVTLNEKLEEVPPNNAVK